MEYELAKKLKDAGFPEPESWANKYAYCASEDSDHEYCKEQVQLIHEDNDEGVLVGDEYRHRFKENKWIYAPTLSDLIEACEGEWGQRFRWLGNEKTHWSAQARQKHPKSKKYPDSTILRNLPDVKVKGSTPEEAVAKLWLALHKK